MSLIQIAFLMLAAGASGGVLFAVMIALGVRYPSWFGAAHGLLGLAAVALLGYALMQGTPPVRAWWAFGVFATGLVGGVTLFRLIFPDRRPLAMAAMHGSLALAGLVLLYPIAYGTPGG
jgi:hypothetical protein